MAWSNPVKGTLDTLDLTDRALGDVPVIGHSVYVIGYECNEGEFQVHIFNVETSSWQIVRFPDHSCGPFPRNLIQYFALAYQDNIYVCGDCYDGMLLFVFNTNTQKWSCEHSYGDDFWNVLSCGACLLRGELYIMARRDDRVQLWALNLSTMHWGKVIDLDDAYCPLRLLQCGSRLYVECLLVEVGHEHSIRRGLVHYDIDRKEWDCLNLFGEMSLSQSQWTSFFYSEHFYFVAKRDERDVFFTYSMEHKELKEIIFEGVPPLYDVASVGNVAVLDNKAIFLEFGSSVVHVLDMVPSLKTRCLAAISRYGLDSNCLPESLKAELLKYKLPASHDNSVI